MNKFFDTYFMEFMELFPSKNDYLCLKEYSDYKRYFENSLSPDHIEIQKKFFNKYNKVIYQIMIVK